MAEAFLGPRPDGLVVRHLDDDRTNNRASNLAYGTASDNQRDSVRNGTQADIQKTHCPAGHAYDQANTYVDPRGSRRCRACNRAQAKASYDARR